MITGQPLDIADRLELRFQRLVLRHQLRQRGPAGSRGNLLHAGQPQFLHRTAGLAAKPRLISGKGDVQGLPFVGGQRRAIGAEHGRDRLRAQRRERAGPGGIDTFEQRQRPGRFDPRQGKARDFLGRDAHVRHR